MEPLATRVRAAYDHALFFFLFLTDYYCLAYGTSPIGEQGQERACMEQMFLLCSIAQSGNDIDACVYPENM
jgi:hypothetical protein